MNRKASAETANEREIGSWKAAPINKNYDFIPKCN